MKLAFAMMIMLFVSSGFGDVRHPLSFDVWKAKKVAQSHADYHRIRDRLTWTKRPLSTAQERALRSAKLNLEIARSLSANEYFIVYLTEKFPRDSKVLRAVTQKMKTRDINDILIEYQRLLLQGETPHYESMHSYQGFDRGQTVQAASKAR